LSGHSGQLAARIGPRLQVTAGALICSAGDLLALRVSAFTGYWTTIIPLECVFGLGIATMVAPLMSAALSSAPADHAGVASAVTNTIGRAAAVLWIAALPPIAGLSGASYASAATLRGGYQDICLMCAASLAIGATVAALALGHHRCQPPAEIVPHHFPHPVARH
jgi:MFS family permease